MAAEEAAAAEEAGAVAAEEAAATAALAFERSPEQQWARARTARAAWEKDREARKEQPKSRWEDATVLDPSVTRSEPIIIWEVFEWGVAGFAGLGQGVMRGILRNTAISNVRGELSMSYTRCTLICLAVAAYHMPLWDLYPPAKLMLPMLCRHAASIPVASW